MTQTIYVDRKTVKLTCEKKQLIFYTEEGRKTTLPFRLVGRLIIHGHCMVDTYLLSKLSENDITTVLLSSTRAKQAAVINGTQHNDASIHLHQYEFSQNTIRMLDAAKKLIKYKIIRQYRFIKQIKKSYPKHHKLCFDAEKAILQQLQNLDNTYHYNHLLGIEGYCAKQYFSVFTQIFSPELNFNGRKKHPAPDPVNAVLSLTYTIFSSRCSQSLISVGLDPYIGFFHKLSFSRQSLAADMIEPWRPLLDKFVSQLFKQQILKAEYFDYVANNCLLNKKGRSLYYPEFEHQMKVWQKGIDRMARYMVREIQQQLPFQQPKQLSLF